MSKSAAVFTPQSTHGHAFYLYDSPVQRYKLLANYLREGIDNNELCVLVIGDARKTATANLKRHGFDPAAALKSGALHIFGMDATYLADGKFVAEYMLHNVASYIEDAKKQGYKGLRTAGEMSWLIDHPDAVPAAIDYEKDVNSLHLSCPDFMGICLYPAQDTFGHLLSGALKSHPSFIHEQHVRTNPYYA